MQCKLAWFITVRNQSNTLTSMRLIRYSCRYILGPHEPIPPNLSCGGFSSCSKAEDSLTSIRNRQVIVCSESFQYQPYKVCLFVSSKVWAGSLLQWRHHEWHGGIQPSTRIRDIYCHTWAVLLPKIAVFCVNTSFTLLHICLKDSRLYSETGMLFSKR